MDLTITSIFYLALGCGVGVAIGLKERSASPLAYLGKPLAAVLFWPLFVPLLMEGERQSLHAFERSLKSPLLVSDDSMSQAIQQVEGELDAALSSLQGWADISLLREQDRFNKLRVAWRVQADRVRELDQLLSAPEFTTKAITAASNADDKRTQFEHSRNENIDRLKLIRDQQRHDLLTTIAWVRELVTMIHLAKYTGAPASRAEELVRQIATAIEGIGTTALTQEAAS